MRLFVAIPLPGALAEAAQRVQDALPAGRSVSPGNLHVTLAFLDDQPPEKAAAVHEALSAVRASRVTLRLVGLDVQGGKTPRLVWMRVEGGDALTDLHAKVCRAVRASGVNLPRTRFRPHVTLARLSRRPRPEDLARLGAFLQTAAGFSAGPHAADRFCLWRSQLHPDGAIHEELSDYALH